jgi:hypothetical protein
MIEVVIETGAKPVRKLCFLVKKGEVNDIVITLDSLLGIDYTRLVDMEKQGGELMKVMRETTLPNGKNALIQYQSLMVTVPKKVAPVVAKPEATVEVVENAPESEKRGRGRPKK